MARDLVGHGLDEIKARAALALAEYEGRTWPPERVDRVHVKRRPSLVLRRCPNPCCREWPLEGSAAAGSCLSCGVPLEGPTA